MLPIVLFQCGNIPLSQFLYRVEFASTGADIQKSILMIHQFLQYHRMIPLSVVIIQGILRGANDGNVRAIDCTDALRKHHLDENPFTILWRPCPVGMLISS